MRRDDEGTTAAIEFFDLVSSPDGEDSSPEGPKQKILKKNSRQVGRYPRRCQKKYEELCKDDKEEAKSRPAGRNPWKSRKKNEELHKVDSGDELFYNPLTLHKRARRSKNGGCIMRQQNKLDTNLFESYLEILWRSTSEDEKQSFTYLDSLWFSLYKEGLVEKGDQKEKVLRWIMEKKIFSCKYVFVPIVCWGHWNLLILCHIGESIDSITKKPCMLLLDSLETLNPKRLEPDIRRFVGDIYKMHPGRNSLSRNQRGKESMSKIPLLVPKVPQQNGDDCGIFVLYYIYLFLKAAPEEFNLEHYPYFLTKEWFNLEKLEIFHKELQKKKEDEEGSRQQRKAKRPERGHSLFVCN